MDPSSEDAFCEELQAAVDLLMARIGAAFGSAQGWRDRLRAVAWALLRFLQEDPERARMMVIEAPEAGERAREIRDQSMAALIELIDEGRHQLDDPDSMTKSTALGLTATIYSHLHAWIQSGDMAAGDALVPELMAIAVTPYLGPRAAEQELQMPPPSPPG